MDDRRNEPTASAARSRLRLAALLVVIGLALGGALLLRGTDQASSGTLDHTDVIVFGDSLIWEARPAIASQLEPGLSVRVESFGGTALCDFTDRILAGASSQSPSLVVIGFTGNNFTPCMTRRGPLDDEEAVAAVYADDLDSILAALDQIGTAVLLVGSPPGRNLDGSTGVPPVNDKWRDAAARWTERGADVTFSDTGQSLTDAGGRWVGTLPCLPIETASMGCVNGKIQVRSADTIHFCPVLEPEPAGVIPECAVWNGGAWRYAQAITDAIRARLAAPNLG